MEPHPDQDESPQAPATSRRTVIAAVVIAGLLLAIVALHLTGAMSLHAR